MRKRIFVPEHPDTIKAMSNLAISLCYIGKIDEALSMQQHVLEKSQRILGLEHPDTIAAMNNLEIMRNMQQGMNE
ncbi:hypothetical protein FH972_024074 [Carpinus fangiana]|uniref:Kinesin light chain n=1 Tax=Carpinus fangiana TaxID=176857 RepID=A0A5N6KXE1_9ROSI|nr:hypothetical protein FH972_024074 [Carpinus fangiana]